VPVCRADLLQGGRPVAFPTLHQLFARRLHRPTTSYPAACARARAGARWRPTPQPRARARQLKGRGGDAGADKRALWRELAAAGFARAAAAAWLLPLLDLLLRVQLNILGRHLFLESNLLDPRRAPPRSLLS